MPATDQEILAFVKQLTHAARKATAGHPRMSPEDLLQFGAEWVIRYSRYYDSTRGHLYPYLGMTVLSRMRREAASSYPPVRVPTSETRHCEEDRLSAKLRRGTPMAEDYGNDDCHVAVSEATQEDDAALVEMVTEVKDALRRVDRALWRQILAARHGVCLEHRGVCGCATDGQTLEEIGRALGMTREAVRQNEVRARAAFAEEFRKNRRGQELAEKR